MARNRESGWKHAKLSGHDNEELVCKKINEDVSFREALCKRLQKQGLIKASVGGLNEESVESILGKGTKSKTDLALFWIDSTKTNISIKKSEGGQVYLITVERFILGMEKKFGNIPDEVKLGLSLMFGNNASVGEILKKPELQNVVEEKTRKYEIRKNRLVYKTLDAYDTNISNAVIFWIKENIGEITRFCFSHGLAKNKTDWVDYVWYINCLDENNENSLFSINDIVESAKKAAELKVFYGDQNGGSTIQLPFGFLQWHKKSMQFHHKLDSIKSSIDKTL